MGAQNAVFPICEKVDIHVLPCTFTYGVSKGKTSYWKPIRGFMQSVLPLARPEAVLRFPSVLEKLVLAR